MKYLKHIKEMDNWASSNRLGGDYQLSQEKIEQFIKEYTRFVDTTNLTVDIFNNGVITLAARLHLSKNDINEINQKKLKLYDYLITAFEKYIKEYDVQ